MAPQQLASLIKAARERASLSQSQAAEKWGVKLKTLQGWEQGRNYPSGKQLEPLLPLLFPAKGRRSK